MKRVLLYGWYGFRNIGDEAILQALVTDCQKLGVEPVVVAGDPVFVSSQFGVKAVRPWPHTFKEYVVGLAKGAALKTLSAFRSSSLLVMGGGGFLSDDHSLTRITRYAKVIQLARRLELPAVLHGVGVGPLQSPQAHRIIREMCSYFSYISVRDEESKGWLIKAGVDRQIHITADPAVSFREVDPSSGREILQRAGLRVDQQRLIGMSLLRPTAGKSTEEHCRNTAQTIDAISRELGAHVVLVPFQRPFHPRYSAESDDSILAELKEYIGGPAPTFLAEQLSPSQVMSVLGCMDAVVGFHLHAMILACTQGVPVVGVPYHFKGRSFLHRVGLDRYSIPYETFTGDLVVSRLKQICADRTAVHESTTRALQTLRLRADLNVDLLAGRLSQ